ncbi:MAG: 2,3-butanediol dehydrogenase [Thermoleophilia bacterium]|nr:2,3-butanediol dehydrogenase [Thermoleophilia bacterium]
MRAAVWHGRHDIRLEDVPEPSDPSGEEVVVEVVWCGICGTDLHEYVAGPIFIPPTLERVVLGHEFSARVVAVGDDVTRVKPGDRVVIIPHQVCRECAFCRRGMLQHCRNLQLVGLSLDGAFARYTVVRQDQLVHLPDAVSDEAGALVEPLAVTLRAMQLPGVRMADDAVVIGAGPIGLCAVATARACGIRNVYVVEKLPRRAALARELGAAEVIDPSSDDAGHAILDLTGGRGVDVALECVGLVATMNQAIELTRCGGLTVFIGIAEVAGGIDLNRAVTENKEIRGCIGYFDGEWQVVVDLLASGRLDPTPLVTHRIDVEDVVREGFKRLVEDKDSCVKVLVRP